MDLERDPITTDPNHRYWKEIIRRDDPEFGKYWLKETIWLDEEQAKNSFKTLNINFKK